MRILEVNDLIMRFGGLTAVDHLKLHIDEGEILGLIGPNGAGKSTAFNCIAGVHAPTEGEIKFRGEVINRQKPWTLCRKGLARTFQIVKPFATKSVLYNVMVGAFATTDKTEEAREKALTVLDTLNFTDKKDVKAGNLTIADRKRLEIRKGPGHRTQAAPARRGHGRAAAGRSRRGGGRHPAHPAARRHDFCHRTHHAGRHGTVRSDRRHPFRQ